MKMFNTRGLFASWVVIFLALSRFGQFQQVAAQTKLGCRDHCGDVDIPYPFGTMEGGNQCYYNDGASSYSFVIFCNESSSPPVPYWGTESSKTNIPVVGISLDNHEITIKSYVAYDCYNSSGGNWWNSPSLELTMFPISSSKNRFTAVGCDTYAKFSGQHNNRFSTGCLSLCTDINDVSNGSCTGIGCCQSDLPRNMKALNISLNSFYNHSDVISFNPCSYAFVAANDYFNFSTASLQKITEKKMPMVLEWAIGEETCDVAKMNATSYMCQENTNCSDADNVGQGYRCLCKEGYQGNPYLSGPNGCQDIDECKTLRPCNGTCTNLPGSYSCSCPEGYNGDPHKDGCKPIQKKKFPALDITLGVSIGFLCLLLGGSWLVMGLKQRRASEERKKFYRDNGGHVLDSLMSQHLRNVETLKVFSAEDLKKATDNYNEKRILGEGGQGTVYKGTVTDKVVAIKKAKMLDRSQVDDFINEVIVLSQINHKNVVRLIGCCLETELPLLVYEFVANGTLSEHIHSNVQGTSLSSWQARLRVAAETAGALSYLHSDATIPIVHRDVKSTNILLDENYTAKVSDFGASRLMPSDQTQLSTVVQGTLGYLDPEYFHLGQLTEKSDVYSFGVVLAELITGLEAISFNKPEKERYLSMHFVKAVKEQRCLEIIDKQILDERNVDHINEVAMLACRCLKMTGEERPSMKEVALELERLVRDTIMHPWTHQVSERIEESEYLLEVVHESNIIISKGNAGHQSMIKTQLIPFTIDDGR